MRRFRCPGCEAAVFFGNDHCGACSSDIVYVVGADRFAIAGVDAERCEHHGGPAQCNWTADDGGLCLSCALDGVPDRSPLTGPFQAAKRRTLRQLLRFGLDPRDVQPTLRFALLESTPGHPVTTGHANGVITLDVAEGNPVRLAEVRNDMGERYRTPVGHVRHEIGHWFWAVFVDASPVIADFRRVFGDEGLDYARALADHYERSAEDPDSDRGWRDGFISNYASAHPWEDFAESFAHYLHITDTLETAEAFARSLADAETPEPAGPDDAVVAGRAGGDFEGLYERWTQLTTTLNELNRSMGVPDPYPFAPGPSAVGKIGWIHHRIAQVSHHAD